ncbi:MAG: S8 family peptidase [Ignavibacteriaceae bacterium]|nr:S8 family peptidase [Ignavibacteriaceae bacterium]
MRYLIVTLILFAGVVFAQSSLEKFTPQLNAVISNSNQSEKLLVWIFFTDKGSDVQKYFSDPTKIVSEKSLKRRAKVLSEDKLISERDLPVNQSYIEQIKANGIQVKQKTKWFNGVSGWATKSELVQIADLPFVKQLDIVYRFRKDNEESLNENPEELNQNLEKPKGTNSFDYGQSFTQLNQITVPQVHDLGYTGTGVTICLMDAGFDRWTTHQVFSSMNVIATWDFVDGDSDVENGNVGLGRHGTNTLSLIGGFYEGQLIGPAFDADFILARTEDINSESPIEEDNWIAAMEWADNMGVDVTSTSLSYLEFDDSVGFNYTWEDMDGNTARITNGADYAVYLGIFVVNSAGNNGNNINHNTLGAPADGDSVIAAGSVSSSGSRSSFSSVGPTVDGRIKPDLMAMGSNNYVACRNNNSCYTNGSGTSYSCPLMAGAAALILQADPSLTPMQLSALLKSTASQGNNPDNLYGWGIINTYAAVQSLVTNSDKNNKVPEDFYVLQNFPNPFNPSTKIRFSVPERSLVKLALYDLLGREITVLFNEEMNPGTKELEFNGNGLASGIYLVKMLANNYQKTIKISLLK